MQEPSDQLEQADKQLEFSFSAYTAAVNRSQPTRMVSLPGYPGIRQDSNI
jgi:hypothetical protein